VTGGGMEQLRSQTRTETKMIDVSKKLWGKPLRSVIHIALYLKVPVWPSITKERLISDVLDQLELRPEVNVDAIPIPKEPESNEVKPEQMEMRPPLQSAIERCRDCGKPAIVGEDRCYVCSCDLKP
jgi:hypothetical protein